MRMKRADIKMRLPDDIVRRHGVRFGLSDEGLIIVGSARRVNVSTPFKIRAEKKKRAGELSSPARMIWPAASRPRHATVYSRSKFGSQPTRSALARSFSRARF